MQTVPLKFAIPLLIILPLMLWFWGTRKYDFMTPRVIPEHELRPDFASPVNGDLANSLQPSEEEPPPPEPEPIPDLDPGDFQVSPSLAEYRSYAEDGTPALLKLAQNLQNDGHIQRAVLAYERIIDSTPSISLEREPAEQALAGLKVSLPRWNVDPEASIPLTINLLSARNEESLQPSLAALSELITTSSGGICQPSFILKSAPEPSVELPAFPIAIWLTVEGEDPEVPSLPVVTVAPTSEAEVDGDLNLALYRLLARRVQENRNLTPLPSLQEGEDPETALVAKITRLSWQRLLKTPIQSFSDEAIVTPNEDPAEGEDAENGETQ